MNKEDIYVILGLLFFMIAIDAIMFLYYNKYVLWSVIVSIGCFGALMLGMNDNND